METPLYISLPLPLAELVAAWWLWRHIAYTRYRALFLLLLSEAFWHVLQSYDHTWGTRVGSGPRMLVRALAVIGVYHFACIRLKVSERIAVIAAATLASCAAVGVMRHYTQIDPLESFFAARQYFHLILAVSLGVLVVKLRLRPIMENQDHRAHRIGVWIWITSLAISGTFVHRGLGYMVFPYTMQTWQIVNVLSYLSLTVNVLMLARRMTANCSCLRPEVYFGKDWLRA